MLKISLLGKIEISLDGENIEDKFASKHISIIALLLLSENRYSSREKMETLLWPDSTIDAAKYNLRYNLWTINKIIPTDYKGNDFIKIDPLYCYINSEYKFESDVVRILNHMYSKRKAPNDLENLCNLFSGDLLEGLYFKNCDEFNTFILMERRNFQTFHLKILKELIDSLREKSKIEDCFEWIDKALMIDPFDEELVGIYLDIAPSQKKYIEAIHFYQHYTERLLQNLGVGPTDYIKNKYLKIKDLLKEEKKIGERKNIKSVKRKTFNSYNIFQSKLTCGIEYFWLSSFLKFIIREFEPNVLSNLSLEDKAVLNLLDNRIMQKTNVKQDYVVHGKLMDLSILNAMLSLLDELPHTKTIEIKMGNPQNMDISSRRIYEILRENYPDKIVIVDP